MVFVSAVVYRCLGSLPQKNIQNKPLEYKECQELFAALAIVLRSTANMEIGEKDVSSNVSSLVDDYLCILHNTELLDSKSEEHFFFTTVSQLAIRFSPEYENNSISLLGNSVQQSTAQPIDVHSQPGWAASRLRDMFPRTESHFVSHSLLGGYVCTQVISETESIVAADNLFFRIY